MTSCNKNLTQLSDKQKSVLTGHLLGDGYLSKPELKGNPCLSIGRKLEDHSYNEWTYNIFIEFCSENALKIEKCKASAFNINAKNTSNGIYTKSTLRTMHIPAFLPYQKLWYPNDKK